MVFIKYKAQGITGIMADGYVGEANFLRNLNWKDWEKKGYLPQEWYWYHLYRNLRADKSHDEGDCISAFSVSVNGYRNKYCQLDREEQIEKWYQEQINNIRNKGLKGEKRRGKAIERIFSNIGKVQLGRSIAILMVKEGQYPEELMNFIYRICKESEVI